MCVQFWVPRFLRRERSGEIPISHHPRGKAAAEAEADSEQLFPGLTHLRSHFFPRKEKRRGYSVLSSTSDEYVEQAQFLCDSEIAGSATARRSAERLPPSASYAT